MAQTTSEILGKLIRKRRSIRKFRSDDIDLHDIEKIFDDLRYMPCPTNRHCFRFLGVRNALKIQAMRQEIVTDLEATAQGLEPEDAETFRNYAELFTFFDKAPLVLIGLYRTFVSRLPSGDPKADTLNGLAEIQAFGGAVGALLLELESRGYGACWMTGPVIAENRLIRLLEVEPPWRLGAIIPVGRPRNIPETPKKPDREKIFTMAFDS